MKNHSKKIVLKGLATTIFAGASAIGLIAYSENGNVKTGSEIREYEAVEDKKDMTIMIYMNGSTLESLDKAATKDIQEIVDNYPKDSSLNIVVESGGTDEWSTEALAGNENKRFIIDDTGIKDVETIGEKNMGEADTLADFINYGMGSYPADRYGIIFWDHGGGSVNGFGDDVNYNDDSLELSEIKLAFEESKAKDEKMDFVGFDACLMSTVETCSTLKDSAKYMIASEEVEPSDGWNYKWLSCLNNKDIESADIGRNIVDEYFNFYNGKKFNLTLSVIDLNEFDKLNSNFREFINNIPIEDEKFLKSISNSRKDMCSFGTGFGVEKIGNMVDMASFVNMLNSKTDSRYFLSYDIGKVVIYNRTFGFSEEPCGMSLYVPVNLEEDLSESYGIYKSCNYLTEYKNFISKYNEFLFNQEGYSFEDFKASMLNDKVTVQLDKEDLENLAAVYLGIYKEVAKGSNVYGLLYTDSDVKVDVQGMISAEPEVEFTYINNQLFSTIEEKFNENMLELYSPVLINGEEAYLVIKYDSYDNSGSVTGVIRGFDANEAQNKISEVKVNDEIIPLFTLKDGSNVSGLDSDKIYKDTYFKGEAIKVGENGLEINEKSLKDDEKVKYSFILVNSKQESFEVFAD